MNRELDPREREVLEFVIRGGTVAAGAHLTESERLLVLAESAGLTVTDRCGCGDCPTIRFGPRDASALPTRVLESTIDGEMVLLHLIGTTPVELELAPDEGRPRHEFPEPPRPSTPDLAIDLPNDEHRAAPLLPPAAVEKIPRLGETEDQPPLERVVWLHLALHPRQSAFDWWVAEIEPTTLDARGYACLNRQPHLAQFEEFNIRDLAELTALGATRDYVLRDESFTARPWIDVLVESPSDPG